MNAVPIINQSTNCSYSFRDKSITHFLLQNEMKSIVYLPCCKGPRYTFKPTKKLLDHIIMFQCDTEQVTNVEILCDDIFDVSDHSPVLAVINVPLISTSIRNLNRGFAWHKITETHISNYQSKLSSLLEKVSTSDIDSMYNDIVNAVKISANDAYLINMQNHTGQKKLNERMMNNGQHVVFG